MTVKLDANDEAFYGGVIAALAVVYSADAETIYREIVGTIDRNKLIARAKQEGDEEWCGLVHYGYCKRKRE